MDSIITETHADGEVIDRIVANLQQTLHGVNRTHAIMSAICLSIILMKPTVDADELKNAVREVSRFICLLVDDAVSDTINPKQDVN